MHSREPLLGRSALNVLFLTFYFRPDLCAGSFRATPLADALARELPAGSRLDVITTQPNRYESFTAQSPHAESRGTLSIVRIALPKHRSGMLDQSAAFFAYCRGVLREVRRRRYDVVVATSSRLMTAVLAAWVARRKRARLYLDIRDIFVDTMNDILPMPAAHALKPVLSMLESFAIKSADQVNLVSGGFADYFRTRYPQQRFSFFTHGIDDEFLAQAPARAGPPKGARRPVTALYAGNIGEGQGLHSIVPPLARRLAGRVTFKIVGDGGRKRELERELEKAAVTNVELLPPMDREELLEAYRTADVLFLHLNDYEAFKKVLPSKTFEYAAVGKPLWAGVSGYAAQFIAAEIDNAAVFEPCDVDGAIAALDTLEIADRPRAAFVSKYGRARINERMAREIVRVAEAATS